MTIYRCDCCGSKDGWKFTIIPKQQTWLEVVLHRPLEPTEGLVFTCDDCGFRAVLDVSNQYRYLNEEPDVDIQIGNPFLDVQSEDRSL